MILNPHHGVADAVASSSSVVVSDRLSKSFSSFSVSPASDSVSLHIVSSSLKLAIDSGLGIGASISLSSSLLLLCYNKFCDIMVIIIIIGDWRYMYLVCQLIRPVLDFNVMVFTYSVNDLDCSRIR